MTRKRGWENSTTSPDWIDVMSLMNAIGALHSGHVEVKESVVGTGFNTFVMVQASISLDVLPGSALPTAISVDAEYPCDRHDTFAAHVFALLYDLDYKISQTYQQSSLWKKA